MSKLSLPTLYKKSSTGKLQEWTVFAEDGQYWSVSGQVEGKKVTAAPSVCKPKNVGRKNETTAEQQAELEARAKWQKKIDEGYVENVDDLGKDTGRVDPMLAKNYDDYKEDVEFPVYCQPKLDGLRCVITRDGAFSRQWKPFVTLGHISELFKELFDKYPNIKAFDGEVYSHELKNQFEDIVSLVKQPKATEEDIQKCREQIQYHCYDYVDTDTDLAFTRRTTNLSRYIDQIKDKADGSIVLVDTAFCSNKAELDTCYDKYMEQGYEGQMIRTGHSAYQNNRTKDLLKRKEFVDEEFEIIGYKQGKGSRDGCICLLLKMQDGKTFDSVPKGGVKYLQSLWSNKEKLVGHMATVKFQNYSKDGIPRFNVTTKIRNKSGEEVAFK